MLTAWSATPRTTVTMPSAAARAGGGAVAANNDGECCVVSVETHSVADLPAAAVAVAPKRRGHSAAAIAAEERGAAGDARIKFKVLSFFVGSTAAGKGRLHQQSIVLSEGVNAATEERGE
jgi:hypothetical protein